MAYAQHEFWVNSTDEHGVRLADHFQQLGRDAELEPPVEFPEVIGYLWEYFLELHSARPVGGMGAGPLTYEGIYAWANLTRRRLAAWEVKALKELDAAWLAQQHDRTKRN